MGIMVGDVVIVVGMWLSWSEERRRRRQKKSKASQQEGEIRPARELSRAQDFFFFFKHGK
jgi:cytochrome c-type biogenesis protein CcmH/NrfF